MGGIMILFAIVVTSLFYVKDYPKIIPILFLTLGFGMIGFLDDYIKVVLKRSMGLRAWQKLVLQFVVTGVFAWYLVNYTDVSLAMKIPFWQGHYLNFGIWNIPILFFIVIGTVNGTNFTDGLDGLASSVTVVVAAFFTVVAIGTGSGIEPVTCAVIGALLGFLLFNVYPAKVFMGDTRIPGIGRLCGSSGLYDADADFHCYCWVHLPGGGAVCDNPGNILQTDPWQTIFKMAPIHHHFELCGWSETRVVTVFSIVTALLCLVALMGV